MPHPVGGERSAVPTGPHDPCLVCPRAICSGFCSGVRTPAESPLLPQRPGSSPLSGGPGLLRGAYLTNSVSLRALSEPGPFCANTPWGRFFPGFSAASPVSGPGERGGPSASQTCRGSSVRSSQAQLGRRGQDALQPGTPRLRQPLLPRCRLPPGLCWVREMGGVVGTVCLVRASCPRALGWADRLSPLGFNTQRKNPFLPPLCDTDSPLYLLGCFWVQGTLTEQKASKWKNNP